MTPLLTSKANLPGTAWLVNQWYDKGGKFALPSRGSALAGTVSRLCPPHVNSPGVSPAQCLTQHGYTVMNSYQPGDRFWPFQCIEGGWLLVLSILLIAATVWLVRRRAA